MDRHPDLAAEHSSLLQFLYVCPHGLAQFDRSGAITMVNPAFACLAMPLLVAGAPFDNLIDLLKPYLPELPNLLKDATNTGTVCDGIRVHLGPAAPGQDPRVLSLTVVRMDEDRNVAVMSDITQQVAQERRLRENEAWFAALAQGADDYAILTVDGTGHVRDWNVSGERLFGYATADIIGRHASEVVTAGRTDAATFYRRLQEASRDGWHLDDGWRRRIDGSRFWGTCMVLPVGVVIPDVDPLSVRYLMVVRDITERRHSAADLRRALTADHLTGVLNRRCFLERAEAELLRQVQQGGQCFIAMVDADNFKAINDLHGHAAGDAALCAIAAVLRTRIHDCDLVGRLGGEEFAVLMPATTPELAEQLAERLRAGVAAVRLEHEGHAISLTVSIGIAESGAANLKQLLVDADAALYDAKHSGRNRVCRFGRGSLAVTPTKPSFVTAAVA